jgi:xanthine dehydrogenase large subunit
MSVGKALPHDSAKEHVTGAARYVDDIPTPANCLHLAFGLSDVAHGAISSFDLEAVRSSEGVIKVMTASDLPFANDVSPSAPGEPLLADHFVHYLGQPVFVVAATSHRAARIAAAKGKVRIRPLPAILTIEDAMANDSRFEQVTWAQGDAPSALATAPHLVEGEMDVGGQEHFYLEGQAALALPDERRMVIHASTQHPSEIQHKVADALGVGQHDVQVVMRRMGGGFGGKESQGNALAVACAVMAQVTGRPCKMRYDRDDDMMITGKRHDLRIQYRAGFDETGKILGVQFKHLIRCGWAQDLSLAVADRAMLHAANCYAIPAIEIESHRLRTHTQSATAFRGFGGPQGMIGIERVMEHAAHHLGIAPDDIRARNFMREGDTTHYGQVVDGFIVPQIWDRLRADLPAREADIATWNTANPGRRRALAMTPVMFGISFTLTHLNQAGALVNLYADGTVVLSHGGAEMGQGLHQKIVQIAAQSFGILTDDVRITASDTTKVPNTSATAASSGADMNGMAVKIACDTIKSRIAAHLALKAGCEPKDVHFRDGKVIAGDVIVSFKDAAKSAYEARVSLSSTGFYATPEISWDRKLGRGRPFYYYAYGAAVTEVELDTLTGEATILRADILHDAGTSLNPAIDRGQIEGGYVQGAGWLTTEELVWDNEGRLRTHAPSTYKIPAVTDAPPVFNVDLWDGESPVPTVFRSKAVGEPPFMLAISVWAALSRACTGVNWPDLPAPATAEALLWAYQRGFEAAE